MDGQGFEPLGHRYAFPFEVSELIVREAWLDESYYRRMRLYRAFTMTKDPRWLRALASIAWKYVVCFSVPEFRFYLRLRFGPLLSTDERSRTHIVALLVRPVMHRDLRHLQSVPVLTEAKELRDVLVDDMRFLGAQEDEPVFRLTASSLSVYPAVRANGVVAPALERLETATSFYEWLQTAELGPSLTVVEDVPGSGALKRACRLAPVLCLTTSARYMDANWAIAFPALRELTLIGTPMRIGPLLPYMPDTLEHIRLELEIGQPDEPRGTISFWGVVTALQRGIKIGPRGAPPRLTLLTGPEEPSGWTEAARIAAKMGVGLEIEIDTVSARRARRWI
jgi:hypothetical protein